MALCLAVGNGGIKDQSLLKGCCQRVLDDGLKRCLAGLIRCSGCRVCAGNLHQHIHRAACGQRLWNVREMPEDNMQDVGRDQLEGLNPAARRCLKTVQQLYRGLNVTHLGKGGGARNGLWEQLHRCRGDNAKRAFRTDKKMPKIIAGIVLAKAAEKIQHAPAHQHNFNAKRQLARRAIANDIQPAGIGAKIAADGAATFGGEVQREVQPFGLGSLMQCLQNAAGLDGHRHIGGVNLADAVHPPQRQNDAVAGFVGCGTAHETGIAALRDNDDVMRVGKSHHLRDLLG